MDISKKIIYDFSSVLKTEKTNINITSENFGNMSLAIKASILHLEKENTTLNDILEIVACSKASKILNEKINKNKIQINNLKSLSFKEI